MARKNRKLSWGKITASLPVCASGKYFRAADDAAGGQTDKTP
jgi:hypothetical protein